MITNKVYRVKKNIDVTKDITLFSGQELEIVMDVVYINGNMVPPVYQDLFMNLILNNPNFFEDDTRNW